MAGPASPGRYQPLPFRTRLLRSARNQSEDQPRCSREEAERRLILLIPQVQGPAKRPPVSGEASPGNERRNARRVLRILREKTAQVLLFQFDHRQVYEK